MNPREVLGLRLWLVRHEMITSGSPTEQFEICVSGACFRGIWIPQCGGHVWETHSATFLIAVFHFCSSESTLPIRHHRQGYRYGINQALRAIPTMSIIVKIWTTYPHVSNVAPYAETSTTDNVPYAELPQTGQKRFSAPR